ncbi:phage tail protein [Bradyrhizobium sp. 2TAF24]|uniref:phage tail protein n=1 Tax=Bradyrhizobium sp. 2TAF24 TaxID=3233011 RepID=UPI003F8E3D32
MADSYVGEIQAFAFGFYPNNWLPCDGRLLSIHQYTPLYSLIGTYYGGNGTVNFALPNLVGTVAMSQGQGPALSMRVIGEQVGSNTVNLTIQEMAAHRHGLQLAKAGASGATPGPTGASNVAMDPSFNGFLPLPATTTFSPNAMTPTGGSQAHPNDQPTLAMIYCICINGVYPSFTS